MESRTNYRRPRLSTRALTTRVAALAGAATLALGAGISWQMAQGADPALGPKAQAQPANASPQVVRTVIAKRVPTLGLGGSVGSSTSSAPASVATAPAPSPAPVTTSTS